MSEYTCVSICGYKCIHMPECTYMCACVCLYVHMRVHCVDTYLYVFTLCVCGGVVVRNEFPTPIKAFMFLFIKRTSSWPFCKRKCG